MIAGNTGLHAEGPAPLCTIAIHDKNTLHALHAILGSDGRVCAAVGLDNIKDASVVQPFIDWDNDNDDVQAKVAAFRALLVAP